MYIYLNHVTALQETRLRGRYQYESFRFHLDRVGGHGNYLITINDTNAAAESSAPRERHGGVATIFNRATPGFGQLRHETALDIPNRYLVHSTEWNGARVFYHNVYAPVEPRLRAAFYSDLSREFPEHSLHIIMGDFNVALNSTVDASNPNAPVAGQGECVQWLADLGTVDVWRKKYPELRLYSSPRCSNRLDYICISERLQSQYRTQARYMEGTTGITGDHLLHGVELFTTREARGRGYWKMPKELLLLPDVADTIRAEAASILAQLRTDSNKGVVWNGWKKRVRKFLQKYAASLASADKRAMAQSKGVLRQLHRNRTNDLLSAEEVAAASAEYDRVQVELRRSRTERLFELHRLENETSSSHFFRRATASLQTNTTQRISTVFRDRWNGIMRSEDDMDTPTELRTTFLSAITKSLDREMSTALDAPLSADELADSIKTMDADKSPGPDGFPARFFQLAPDTFGEILSLVFTQQLERGVLLKSQRQSAVALLHKGGAEGNPGSYRPIALMPVETKVVSRVLARRLGRHLPYLIHTDQQGFVVGRVIHDHVMHLQELQHAATRVGVEAYATFLDFEKAYDRVDWSYLWLVLGRFGIGPRFLQWIQLMYTKPIVNIAINGALSAPIFPNRGVKQGDPLSSLLFHSD
ncbi:Endonuclease [Achlya hypogyna]|uniref:Endonuclease n=1 Tax=Achlya hypogyna TaxID=1202772 RepID=A0A1V9YR94_ACHHY|nr:Endonuclease [Achlya hypogyna]